MGFHLIHSQIGMLVNLTRFEECHIIESRVQDRMLSGGCDSLVTSCSCNNKALQSSICKLWKLSGENVKTLSMKPESILRIGSVYPSNTSKERQSCVPVSFFRKSIVTVSSPAASTSDITMHAERSLTPWSETPEDLTCESITGIVTIRMKGSKGSSQLQTLIPLNLSWPASIVRACQGRRR